jgi:5-deoxy-glucuronate isomerase
MEYVIRKNSNKDTSGFSAIVGEDQDLIKLINLGILNLEAGQEFVVNHPAKESVVVLLSGNCSAVSEAAQLGRMSRESVFKERASAIWSPPGVELKITAAEKTQLAVILSPASGQPSSTDSDRQKLPVAITPADVKVDVRGKGHCNREVHNIVDESIPSQSLLVGETFNPPGNWSSYPPHKHEKEDPPVESKHEEVYYFRVEPEQGFALMRLYNDRRDEAVVVEDGDTVLLPDGFHPVAAPPGYSVYYLWILAGKTRQLRMNDDPRHSWVRSSEGAS